MDDLFVAAVGAVAALIGFGAHALATRFHRKEPEATVQVTTAPGTASYTITPPTASTNDYEYHDWHIRGKVEGKVIQYCLLCGAERERP